MFAIRLRDDAWAVVSELDGAVVAAAPTRFDALDELRKLYDVDPALARLEWAENRIISSAALRWRNRYQLGGTLATITAAVRLADPAPLSAAEVAWLDDLARSEPEHRHLSRDLAGRAWPMTAAVTRSRLRRLSHELAVIDQRLGDRLYAGAVTAMRDALRRAGVKATVRAKNRGKQATALLAAQGMTTAVLAAISVSPDELLDRAFAALRTDSEEWMIEANRRRATAIAVAFDQDPDDFDDNDDQGDRRAEEAAALLALLLLRRARRALSDSSIVEGDVRLAVPFSEVRTAMRVRDGWKVIQDIRPGPNVTPEADAGLTMVPPDRGTDAIDELLGKASDGMTFTRSYEFVWGYFGDPQTPFPPHRDICDGLTYDDETRSEVLAKDPSEFPYGRTEWSVDDHDSCSCYEILTYEPVD